LIIEYSTRIDLIKKHKDLLNILVWEDKKSIIPDLVQAVECSLNTEIPDLDGNLKAHIYVDDILASAVNKQNMLRLLAAINEAIFTVYNCPNIEVHQCLLSLKIW
jgi:hypothetical protein